MKRCPYLVEILKTCGDWQEVRSGGVCPYCGKVAGQPQTIDLVLIEKALKGTAYPDPEARLHKHGLGTKEQVDPFFNPLSNEWIYVLCPETCLIEIWTTALYTPERAKTWKRWRGSQYRAPISGNIYTHVHITDILLSEPEPDWKALEKRIKAMALTN